MDQEKKLSTTDGPESFGKAIEKRLGIWDSIKAGMKYGIKSVPYKGFEIRIGQKDETSFMAEVKANGQRVGEVVSNQQPTNFNDWSNKMKQYVDEILRHTNTKDAKEFLDAYKSGKF